MSADVDVFSDAVTDEAPWHVVLLVNEEAHIQELGRLASLLIAETRLKPVIYMEDRLKPLGVPAIFQDLGLEVLSSSDFPDDSGGEQALAPSPWSWRRRIAAALVATNRFLLAWLPARLQRYLKFKYCIDIDYVDLHRDIMLKRAGRADHVLAQRQYSALVMSEDNVELDTFVWISVARRRRVKSIVLPYTISNTAEFAESYLHHAPSQVSMSWQNRITAALFPHWSLRYKQRHFLRTSYAKVVATEALGLAPPNPWLLNSGAIDVIAVESPAMQDYYRAAGIPDRQLAVVGSLTDDVLAQVAQERAARRAALDLEFGFVADQPMVLAALPPDQNTYDRPGSEFADFADLIGFWGKALAGISGWNVLVRPHPKTRLQTLAALRECGVAISYRDTAELVPLCDLYVASVSATIRWAIACGKPVVNYDVYQYGYRDYEAARGVTLVTTRADFIAALGSLTSDPVHLSEQAEIQRCDSKRWAVLDSSSGRRMVALLGAGTSMREINTPDAVSAGNEVETGL
ncbi:hypothetical protein AB8B21_03085 [Tardiphaga sp. 866_E4_N2_1]|uniref:hypothetical protein n=1 Tax=unclassified Tardiphaga TaxID=2631404 RepID=UPI003F1F8DF5